mmetsp:Transcript_18323/g.56843  ORF Transcript_18323/g.56843 Transcript_18323/m.56843 type:complete len:221 (+) Transcript_18323:1216-1878(+)
MQGLPRRVLRLCSRPRRLPRQGASTNAGSHSNEQRSATCAKGVWPESSRKRKRWVVEKPCRAVRFNDRHVTSLSTDVILAAGAAAAASLRSLCRPSVEEPCSTTPWGSHAATPAPPPAGETRPRSRATCCAAPRRPASSSPRAPWRPPAGPPCRWRPPSGRASRARASRAPSRAPARAGSPRAPAPRSHARSRGCAAPRRGAPWPPPAAPRGTAGAACAT